MTREELISRLQGFEWRDLEVKQAREGMPKGIYETVSAFANTDGGHIVFGIKEAEKKFEIVGVIEVDKVQNEFLTGIRSPETISYAVDVQESLINEGGASVLVFYIPEAPRQSKPVHLKRDISRSYIRKGACDHRCTAEEVSRFLRNAGQARFDGQPVERGVDNSFDKTSVQWYRDRFQARNPSSAANEYSDLDFLEHWGLIVERDNRRWPTAASLLLFGTGAAIRSVCGRPLADAFWYGHRFGDAQPDVRWLDRKTFEGNLIQTWRELLEWYMLRRTSGFGVDPDTLERSERPADYISFREAAVNLLTHQDFEEVSNKATISFYSDQLIFKNPGHAFEDREALLKPGDKSVRNSLVVEAFRRVGVGERAGTGIRAIFQDWHRLGRVPPLLESDVANYEFRLTLLQEELITERQLIFQASLGARLRDDQAAAMALLCRVPSLTVTEISIALSRSSSDSRDVLESLVTQVLATDLGEGRYQLAPHLRERWPLGRPMLSEPSLISDQAQANSTSLITDQGQVPLGEAIPHTMEELSEGQRGILSASDTPRKLKELMERAGVSHRPHFKEHYLQPLVVGGLLRLQFPDKPTHPSQRYVLTEFGAKLVAYWTTQERKQQDG